MQDTLHFHKLVTTQTTVASQASSRSHHLFGEIHSIIVNSRASSFKRFLDHTRWRTTVGRTPLDEWSARRKDLYLTTLKHSRQTNIHAPGGIRTHDLSRRAAADLCLRLRDHWDRQVSIGKSKGKAIPLQAWTGPEGSRTLRFPDFKTIGTWRW